MRTTINLDDATVAEAVKVTGIQEKPRLIQEALRALIKQEKARRLAALGGSEKKLKPIVRRRIA